MIDLRRKLLVLYVIKRIMKFKYKNSKKRALFLSVNSIKTYQHVAEGAQCGRIKQKHSGLIAS